MKQLINSNVGQYLEQLSHFGTRPNAGITRFVYDEAWTSAMDFVLSDAQTRGMKATIDSYGNGFMTYPGKNGNSVIAAGSHIDTVHRAGKFDGAYGVAAAVIAMSNLVEQYGQPAVTMTAVAFSEEEGSRFPTSFSGSKHYAGVQETPADLKDDSGTTFADAKARALATLTKNYEVVEQALPKEFLELHIEQGPLLEASHVPLGIVTAICEQKRFTVTIEGQTNHAGTTPQHLRRDALKAAAALICRLDNEASRIGEPLVFTVGEFTVSPGSSNVIPGKVQFSVDMRHPDKRVVDEFEAFLRQEVRGLQAVSGEVERWMDSHPAIMDSRLVDQFKRIITDSGQQFIMLPSGAGHDTQIMNIKVPTAMLFVPSRGGISHAPEEYTKPADLELGVRILEQQLYRECYE
ncbi:M20 family metallo-hydrolase [Lentilactobacillus parafarraginis]|uniref:Amidase, hydantoinase carbamoylase family n=2 Tax=Lentilactobacillus parafarraginis TaxID=390842 RepID=A0A0R1YML1_9LACO|nr:M20 family metallo-hydrolase [Lentilactobacillus parafarraginis]KRM43338.1 amidase, hydantoinase carbamoylase family [Lentilactobacillus parafarraginis DSM 18390 = JCM 14109]TLQ18464.1 M20 family metallo-hydrolase [Lentilactobacillus parafarraginis]